MGILDQILHTQLIEDRERGINILRQLAGDRVDQIVHNHYTDIERGRLHEIMVDFDELAEHYSCILYPYGEPTVNILKLNYASMESQVNMSRNNYGVHFWYIPWDV